MVPLAPRVTSGLASNKTHEVGTIVAKCSVAYNQLLHAGIDVHNRECRFRFFE